LEPDGALAIGAVVDHGSGFVNSSLAEVGHLLLLNHMRGSDVEGRGPKTRPVFDRSSRGQPSDDPGTTTEDRRTGPLRDALALVRLCGEGSGRLATPLRF